MSDRGALIHRNLRRPPPFAAGGEGVFLIGRDGKKYLDGSSGAVVSCLGHQHPDVLAAMDAQLRKLAFAHNAFFTSEAAETLAAKLCGAAPGNLNHALFVSGGSEAVEAAMKIARQFFVERGETKRVKFIARRQSYHGATLAALAVGHHEARREMYRPMLLPAEAVSPAYGYRHRGEGEGEEQYAKRLAAELAATIERCGADSVAAFIAETVSGASLGAVTAPAAYFREVRKVCDRYGVLLIADEIMCGMGRCGQRFAFTIEGIVPDLVCLAKALGGGYAPIGAVLADGKIIDAITNGSGMLGHGHTYLCHPLAAAAALAVHEVVERDSLIAQARRRGALLGEIFRHELGDHPSVGDIRGRGLFIGIELVRDKTAKQPFTPAGQLTGIVQRCAMERGMLCYPANGCADGRNGDAIIIAPPYIISESQCGDLAARTVAAIFDALNTVA